MKTTLHFVYRVNHRSTKLINILERLFSDPFYRRFHSLIVWPNPIYAPLSITANLLQRFKKDFNVKLYDISEKGDKIKLDAGDILLFHPSLNTNRYSELDTWTIDKESASWIALSKYNGINKIIVIFPYAPLANQTSLHDYFKLTQNVILICGDYWVDNWKESPHKDVLKRKPVQINMGIDFEDYLVVKNNINPKGKRKFLYVGNTMPWKNTIALEKIASQITGFEGGYISSGEIKGWKKISNFAHLTADFMKEISAEYDFFLSPSALDAQATTVLEQMCFGMAVASTPESGYLSKSIIQLHTTDTDFNVKQITKMQEMDEDEYFRFVNQNMRDIKSKYSWDRIYSIIYDCLKT